MDWERVLVPLEYRMELIYYEIEIDQGKLIFIKISEINNGKPPKNTYSSYPLYLKRENSNNFHILYLRNSFPLEYQLKSKISNDLINIPKKLITFTILGGNCNLIILLRDN